MDYEFDLRIGKTGKGFYNSVCEAPVAQLDRASVYGTEGYTFEPCRCICKPLRIKGLCRFCEMPINNLFSDFTEFHKLGLTSRFRTLVTCFPISGYFLELLGETCDFILVLTKTSLI